MKHFNRLIRDTIMISAGAVIAVVAGEMLENRFENWLLLLIAANLILITVLVTLTGNAVDNAVRDTLEAMGIRVRYIEDRWIDGQYREGKVFDSVRQIVAQAENEILISGYNDPQFDPTLTSIHHANFADNAQKRRIAYLETIERKLHGEGNSFKYYRVIQMPNAHSIKLSNVTLGPVEFEHCKSVLEIQSRTRNRHVRILKMETERISTFMIVDGKFLILSDIGSRRTDQGQDGEYLAGVFIIEDWTGTVISGFRDYFWSELVPNGFPVELKDLFISSDETRML